MPNSVKEFLKRSVFLATVVNHALRFRYKWTGGLRTNYEIVDRLAAFSPYSAGTLRARGGLALQSAQQTFPLICKLLKTTSDPPREPVPLETFFVARPATTEADELADLFRLYRSDKSLLHNYHLLYGPLLSALKRSERLRILEIGLGTNNTDVISHMGSLGTPGASLRAFRDFLPNAELYGADVDRRILFSEARIKTYYVDQTNPDTFSDLAGAMDAGSFDLIIDDGLHSPNANIATLIFALQSLKPNGFFIIEDIGPESIPIWQVVSKLLPDEYNANLIQAKNGLLFLMQKPDNLKS